MFKVRSTKQLQMSEEQHAYSHTRIFDSKIIAVTPKILKMLLRWKENHRLLENISTIHLVNIESCLCARDRDYRRDRGCGWVNICRPVLTAGYKTRDLLRVRTGRPHGHTSLPSLLGTKERKGLWTWNFFTSIWYPITCHSLALALIISSDMRSNVSQN